jgi:hypothetical protein
MIGEGRSGIHHDPSLADDTMGGDYSVDSHRLLSPLNQKLISINSIAFPEGALTDNPIQTWLQNRQEYC